MTDDKLEAADNHPDPNKHAHSHSLYVLCLSCRMWGVDFPSNFMDQAICGNCKSGDTVKYYPSCCLLAAFEQGKLACSEAMIRELGNWKWEYENLCKFATDFETKNDSLKAKYANAIAVLKQIFDQYRDMEDISCNDIRQEWAKRARETLRELGEQGESGE